MRYLMVSKSLLHLLEFVDLGKADVDALLETLHHHFQPLALVQHFFGEAERRRLHHVQVPEEVVEILDAHVEKHFVEGVHRVVTFADEEVGVVEFVVERLVCLGIFWVWYLGLLFKKQNKIKVAKFIVNEHKQ